MGSLRATLGIAACLLGTLSAPVRAQAPDERHLTIRTDHFAVHFTPELELLARRAAASAERAYTRLSAELTPPRGTIDLLVADNVDYANGYATVFPTNRIVVFAHPPIDARPLRANDDWMDLVVTHELAHVFHLDRSRGMWRMLQYVFGRSPVLFPHAYSPRWVTEGIATYYESRLTGAGRVSGTEHAAVIRAAAVAGRLPRLDQVTTASPVFPGGQGVYIYGSLFMDYLARERGPERIRALIERQAVHPVPFMLNRVSRVAFGMSYAEAWRLFTDSLARSADADRLPLPGWRDLSPASFSAEFLRFLPTGELSWSGSAPRALFGTYASGDTGSVRFIGRRNGATPTVAMPGGALLYAQPDYVDNIRFRTDLYLERDGRVERLTRGARLAAPDARADGRVVAVQALPGASRLVLFDVASRAIGPLAGGTVDEQWSEPVWSPDGTRIAAARWRRGGASGIVVLDTTGRVEREIGVARAIVSTPAWSPDGRRIVFSSDASGRSELYVADLVARTAVPTVRRVSDAGTAIYEPQLSPDGRWLAAVRLAADGYRVGIAPAEALALATPETTSRSMSSAPYDSVVPAVGAPTRYAAWRQLLPRYWLPLLEDGLDGTQVGFATSGGDVLARHAYAAELAVPLGGPDVEGYLSYQYAGFGRPIVTMQGGQDWTLRRGAVRNAAGDTVARIARRAREAVVGLTFSRPRVRSSSGITLSAGAEQRANVVVPSVRINAAEGFLADSVIPRAAIGASYIRTRAAPYAISPEDGFSLSGNVSSRWVNGMANTPARTLTAATTGYRSFLGGGYARHVAALRLAGGITERRTTSPLEVGGASGSEVPLLFGFSSIGEGRRTFFVRGFDAAALYGTHALAGSMEYRAPLRLFARGLGLLPLFVDRTSFSLFADAGSAWCPSFRAGVCSDSGGVRPVLASTGAEARVTTAIATWDAPFIIRGGVAVPVAERRRARQSATFYITSGLSF